MKDPASTLLAIQTFVELARTRRTRALEPAAKAQIEALDQALRDLILGARPAPRKIANPTAVATTTPGHGVSPAKIQVKASQALEQALELSTQDKKKLGSVKLEDLPKSSYTPPRLPAFMADYYSDTLVPARVTTADIPSQAVTPTGETMDLAQEVRVLLGLERPPAPEPTVTPGRARAAPPPVAASAGSAPAVSAPPAPAPALPMRGIPVIVHMMAGGTQRGRVEHFQPDSGHLELLGKDPAAAPNRLPLSEVLAVLVGARRDGGVTEATGTALVVKLVNERQVAGISPDYDEGGAALTLVPEPRRGSIDHIWVPAWAVKSIELT